MSDTTITGPVPDSAAPRQYRTRNGELAMSWSAEHDEALRKYRRANCTYRDCARFLNALFGTSYTKNSCISRGKRLGLPAPPQIDAVARAQTAVKREETKRLQKQNPERAPQKRGRRTFGVVPEPAPAASARDSTTVIRARNGENVGLLKRIRCEAQNPPATPDLGPLRCVEIEPKHISIYELTDDTCRWPYGGDGQPYTFCGHFALIGSYCDAHRALSVRRETVTPLAPAESEAA